MTMRGQRNVLLWASAVAIGVTAAAFIAYSISQNQKVLEGAKASKIDSEETDVLDQGMHGTVW